MSGVLKHSLAVRQPETGQATALLAGDPVPDWATDLVHPDDLEGDEPGGDAEAGEPPAKKAAAKRSPAK